MGTTTLGGAKKFIKYSECNDGDMLVKQGRFLGSYQGTYGICWEFDVDGEITVLNSAGQLNYVLENYATEGDVLDVMYEGKKEVPKGAMKGKMAHQFKVDRHGESAAKHQAQPKSELSLDDLE